VAGRSDPDEINFYLQTFLKSVAPDVWNANKQATSAYPWDPITERMGPLPGITRNGAEQQLDQLASAGCGVIGVCSGEEGGVAAAPPSMVKETFSLAFQGQPHPSVPAQMQNATGDWISPS